MAKPTYLQNKTFAKKTKTSEKEVLFFMKKENKPTTITILIKQLNEAEKKFIELNKKTTEANIKAIEILQRIKEYKGE